MYNQTKKKKRGQLAIFEHWPLILAVILFASLLTTINLFANLFTAGPTALLYFLESPFLILLRYIGFPIIFLMVIWKIINRKRFGVITTLSDVVAVSICICAGLLVCASMMLSDSLSDVKDRLEHDEHIFALVSRNTYDDMGYGRFALYQCDKLGFICSQVYETDWGIYTDYPARLDYVEATSSISIIINDALIHTYEIR